MIGKFPSRARSSHSARWAPGSVAASPEESIVSVPMTSSPVLTRLADQEREEIAVEGRPIEHHR